MIKHIVFWRLKNREDAKSRDENARAIKERIEGLRGKIPGLLHIEAGIDFNASETACDVVLYSEFESRAALDGYQIHPAHLEMAKFIGDRRSERRIADYEI
jgi:Stress responsive A/B Barrel Domain